MTMMPEINGLTCRPRLERYVVSGTREETACDHCGEPRHLGETVFTMKYFDVPPNSEEWSRMWAHLRQVTGGDGADRNPESYEVWQYMGTWPDPDPPPPWLVARMPAGAATNWPKWAHSFRHRDRPAGLPPLKTGGQSWGRINLYLYPSPEYLVMLPAPEPDEEERNS